MVRLIFNKGYPDFAIRIETVVVDIRYWQHGRAIGESNLLGVEAIEPNWMDKVAVNQMTGPLINIVASEHTLVIVPVTLVRQALGQVGHTVRHGVVDINGTAEVASRCRKRKHDLRLFVVIGIRVGVNGRRVCFRYGCSGRRSDGQLHRFIVVNQYMGRVVTGIGVNLIARTTLQFHADASRALINIVIGNSDWQRGREIAAGGGKWQVHCSRQSRTARKKITDFVCCRVGDRKCSRTGTGSPGRDIERDGCGACAFGDGSGIGNGKYREPLPLVIRDCSAGGGIRGKDHLPPRWTDQGNCETFIPLPANHVPVDRNQ